MGLVSWIYLLPLRRTSNQQACKGTRSVRPRATPALVKQLRFLTDSVVFLPFRPLPAMRQENQFRMSTYCRTFHSAISGNSSTVLSVNRHIITCGFFPTVKISHNIPSVFPLSQQRVCSTMCKSVSGFFQGADTFLVIILTFSFVEK